MAEPAVGAVSLLLGVIRKEAALLGGVGTDVQFIKEEMESMKSFLAHLARTAPPGGEHNEQVRTWMDQVRRLALDCNGCIDLYLYRGHREAHRASWGGLRRYVMWLPWLLQKMEAQHRAANQLRELKDRARDVSERRSRYGVEIPVVAATVPVVVVQPPPPPGAGGGTGPSPPPTAVLATPVPVWASQGVGDDDEQDGNDQLVVAGVATSTDHLSSRRGTPLAIGMELLIGGRDKEDYFSRQLVEWMRQVWEDRGGTLAVSAIIIPSIAIVAGCPEDAHALAHQALAVLEKNDVFRFWDNVLLVDIAVVHSSSDQQPPEPEDILYCIVGHAHAKGEEHKGITTYAEDILYMREQQKLIHDEIKTDIRRMDVNSKIESMVDNIEVQRTLLLPLNLFGLSQVNLSVTKMGDDGEVQDIIQTEQDWVLVQLLTTAAIVAERDQERKKAIRAFAARYDDIIEVTAQKLKARMEEGLTEKEGKEAIRLPEAHYAHILWSVFPRTSVGEPRHGQDQQERKADGQGEISDSLVHAETLKKMKNIGTKIKEQLEIKGITNKIEQYLKPSTMIILKINEARINRSRWEQIRDALSLTRQVAGALVVTTTTNTQQAKQYCHPPREPIDCSLSGLYHDAVLKLTSSQMPVHEDKSYDPLIFRDILDKCEQHEFCMKIFVHALYANPKRSNQALHKLRNTLQVSPKSLESIAEKMIKFSYNNMPEEYKSCLLYLSIFPKGHRIRRSTLIARWVVEGLITREDWPTSVRQAERCFDTLIDRCLVYPVDIGATGWVISCMVGHLVHGFIFKMASKQHIVEARLSNHLARHFSIFNDLQLRSSQTIHSFLGNLSVSSRLCLIKVLDLEGCSFGSKGKGYLKGICSQVLLLKYLSLRRTDVKQIPNEINSLHELEVLDIRQTKVCMSATESLLLLKLKRLLAGHNNLSQSSIDIGMPIRAEELSTVHVPNKIGKMVDMEVLSNVKARNSQDLRSIARLWQLRKLGVVIDDKDSHLKNLLEAVSDLHDCLHSLSITIVPKAGLKATPSSEPYSLTMRYHPKLESLSISGTTNKVQLLQLLLAEKGNNQLTKVTLSKTYLSQNDLEVLATLPNLQCVRLRHKAYKESKLTLKVDEFQHLKYFLVEGFDLTDIIFENGAAGELEKIVLPLSDGLNLSGIDKLTRLKEIELNNNNRKPKSSSSSQINTNGIKSSGNNINSITAAATNTAGATATTDTTDATATPTTDAIKTTAVTTAVTNTAPANTTIATATNTDDTAPTTGNNATATTSITATTSATPTTATASTPAATTKIAASAPTMNTSPAPHTTNTTAPITTDTAAIVTINPAAATIKSNMFLSLLENAKAITKVTLYDTMLKEDDLQILAKKTTILCLVLLNKSCAKSQLTFNKNDFPKLSLLILECDNMEVSFTAGSCLKLERFVWTFTKIKSLSGIDNPPRLKEVEFKGDFVPNEVKDAINKLKNRVHVTYYESENQDQAEGNPLEEDIVPKFSCF